MRKKRLFGLIVLLIMGLFHFPPEIASAADLIVIGNRSVPVTELSPNDIKNIYLNNKRIWDNGMKVEITVLSDGSTTDRFLAEYVKKNSSTFNNFWKKQIFIGGGKPPIVFEKEKDLVDYVSKTRGAVGYLTSQPPTDNVKILAVLH